MVQRQERLGQGQPHQGVGVGLCAGKSRPRPIANAHETIERSRRQGTIQLLSWRETTAMSRLVGAIAHDSEPRQQYQRRSRCRILPELRSRLGRSRGDRSRPASHNYRLPGRRHARRPGWHSRRRDRSGAWIDGISLRRGGISLWREGIDQGRDELASRRDQGRLPRWRRHGRPLYTAGLDWPSLGQRRRSRRLGFGRAQVRGVLSDDPRACFVALAMQHIAQSAKRICVVRVLLTELH